MNIEISMNVEVAELLFLHAFQQTKQVLLELTLGRKEEIYVNPDPWHFITLLHALH